MKSTPWYIIAFFFTLAGILLEVIFFIPASELPSRLPSPPTAIDAILGVSGDSFFEADPWVLTIDKKTFGYLGNNSWENNIQLPQMMMSEPCQNKIIKLFERSVARIKDCLTVQPHGEWCPAPITSFAITVDGDIWKYEKNQFCTIFFSFAFPVFAGGGFVVGILVVLIRKFRHK